MSNGFLQLCHNQSHAALPFGKAESMLHFHTLAFIQKVLCFVSHFILFGPSTHRARQMNTLLFAIAQTLSILVDFVFQSLTGIMPLAFPGLLCHGSQIASLVVGIKGEALQPSPPIYHANVQLCTKLRQFSGFAPHNEPEKRLADADDSIRHRMVIVPTHIFLLLKENTYSCKTVIFPL